MKYSVHNNQIEDNLYYNAPATTTADNSGVNSCDDPWHHTIDFLSLNHTGRRRGTKSSPKVL